MKVFDRYAIYYDFLYSDKNYVAESEFVVSLIRKYVSNSANILEMGCGTGIHAMMLAKAGFDVHAIDLSETMLAIARERRMTLPPEIRDRLNFSLGDIRTYRAGRVFDVVLSLFHVVGYQTTNEELLDTFETAARHLDQGGIFVFDYWYGPAVLSIKPETRVKRFCDKNVSIIRIAEPRMDDLNNIVEVNYETLVMEQGGVDVVTESHHMRYFFIPEIELVAKMNGFESVIHCGWMETGRPSIDSWSALSVLRKL